MKKIIYLIFTLLLIIHLKSCDESFLDTVPTDRYNEANWWQTEAQVLSTLNGVYRVLNGSYIGGPLYLTSDCITPNMLGGMNYGVPLDVGAHNPGNLNWFQNKWDACYQGIGRANYLLDNIDKVPMSESLNARLKAEAYFLRALFYSHLVDYYGGVPLILEAPDFVKHGNLPRNTRQEVINQVLIDLNNAAATLPVSYPVSERGRATKGAALTLKARVLLYESRWAEAAATAKEVMDMNHYSLFPSYRGVFLAANQNNQEVIFDVQYSSPNRRHALDDMMDIQISFSPTADLVNSYLMIDGLPIGVSPLYDPSQPYENRDPRLHQTVVIGGYMWKGAIAQSSKYFNTGYGLKKWTIYEDNVSKPLVTLGNSDLNVIMLRYADLLLMYAEAQNEAVGPDASVYESLNKIRNRAGMPSVLSGLSKDEMREVIRHERRIELAGEGHYYQDIRRWRTAEVVMNAVVLNNIGEVRQTRSFNKDRDYLWPIHEIVIQENPALEQNPGY
jgi:starch-binding outer membrane protein, SusD/RagB family